MSSPKFSLSPISSSGASRSSTLPTHCSPSARTTTSRSRTSPLPPASPADSCTTTSAVARTSTSGCCKRLGAQREQRLRPPIGRSARARIADTVSRWLDWTEANRAIWLATLARGEDIAEPEVRRVVADLMRRAVGFLAAQHPEHRRGLTAAAPRTRVLDRTEPRRDTTLAQRRSHPRGHGRVAHLDTRARPTNVWLSSRAKAAAHPRPLTAPIALHARQPPARSNSGRGDSRRFRLCRFYVKKLMVMAVFLRLGGAVAGVARRGGRGSA